MKKLGKTAATNITDISYNGKEMEKLQFKNWN